MGETSPAGSAANQRRDLSGTDCSDGLARCVAGHVEVSRLGHVPHPCEPRAGVTCACPWDDVGACEVGCAAEHLEISAEPDAAKSQLCSPRRAVERELLPDEVPRDVCAGLGFSCVDNVVRECSEIGRPVRAIARCIDGCASGVNVPLIEGTDRPGAPTRLDGVVAILCRRNAR